jgi:hypothetical protein
MINVKNRYDSIQKAQVVNDLYKKHLVTHGTQTGIDFHVKKTPIKKGDPHKGHPVIDQLLTVIMNLSSFLWSMRL